jgi:uncharacterized protein YbbK (DUF523 family)
LPSCGPARPDGLSGRHGSRPSEHNGPVASPEQPDHDRPVILVSACLLGVACNHLGQASPNKEVMALEASARLVAVCPEVVGGLPTPRPAAERSPDGRVQTAEGADVTSFYERGATHAVTLARAVGAGRAIMKARSPSCGCGRIYDGTHRHLLRDGDGVTVAALRKAGIEVISDEDLPIKPPDGSPG